MLVAAILLILSSFVGLIAAIVHAVALDATLMGAVGTYFVTSLILSSVLIVLAARASDRAPAASRVGASDLDAWDRWREEEDWQDAASAPRTEAEEGTPELNRAARAY